MDKFTRGDNAQHNGKAWKVVAMTNTPSLNHNCKAQHYDLHRNGETATDVCGRDMQAIKPNFPRVAQKLRGAVVGLEARV